ncbi:MAG: GtrA family protein [Streptococcaceae bacterium]|jgi:putative flippase GtrA|nr:GtrA family protein [Streptococcaceae bacterium]
MQKIKSLASSETIRYLFFGGLATLVYIIVKFITWRAWHSGWASETAAQSASILFAFVTNKLWVFEKSNKPLYQEFLTFVSGRIVMLLFGIAMNAYFIDAHPQILENAFGWSKNTLVAVLNGFIQVFTILVNWVYSKFIVFRKSKKEDQSSED